MKTTRGLRATVDSLLDMKEEYDTAMYYVNVIIKNGSDNDMLEGDQDGEKGNSSQESVCNSSAEDLEGEEGSSNHIRLGREKTTFGTARRRCTHLP
jgi:hypothetical protein